MREAAMAAMVTVGWVLTLSGCAGDGGAGGNSQSALQTARSAYDRGSYSAAFEQASAIARRSEATGGRAAYLAGLAARQQGNLAAAERYLRLASRRGSAALVGDARGELGVVLSQRGQYGEAARVLERASRDLVGEDKAQALFFAGIARQKLGQWQAGRRLLRFARSATGQAALRQRIDRQMRVNGYTIQVGAFSERANARTAARQWRSRARRHDLRPPHLLGSKSKSGSTLTLVQLGRFNTVAAANRAKARLNAGDAIVVPLAE
jgi:tetratricopeptide (TPR) repeat protein